MEINVQRPRAITSMFGTKLPCFGVTETLGQQSNSLLSKAISGVRSLSSEVSNLVWEKACC